MRPIVRTAAIWILALSLIVSAALAATMLVFDAHHPRGEHVFLGYYLAATFGAPPVVCAAGRLAVLLQTTRFAERVELGKTMTLSCLGLGSLGSFANMFDSAVQRATLANFLGEALAAGLIAVVPVGCGCLLWNLLAARPRPSDVASTFD